MSAPASAAERAAPGADGSAADGGGQATIALALVAHTNVGKTTLARTLLGRDVGAVRDAPHVTDRAEAYTMVRSDHGDRLLLWDTPGFGDSVRLARRLAQAGHPLGWFLSQVWDRLRDRALWSSQQAVRNVRDHADVVLYLVNAAEDPDQAAYVASEMRILGYVGKPVVVLLNQTGPPREPAAEHAQLVRWQRHLAPFAFVRGVLPLDAFARCWVQELQLLDVVGQTLPAATREAFDRLRRAWQQHRLRTFDASIGALAASLARSATDVETVADDGLRERLREAGAALGVGAAGETARARAMQQLAQRLDAEVQQSTGRLIALHGLEGSAQQQVLQRLAEHYEVRARVDEGRAALIGGAVTGALAGLKADLATGGLTLGGGLLAGGLLGALGAAGLARGVNLVRGTGHTRIVWSEAALLQFTEAALLRYLAVAHYGRGRGQWREAEAPAHWRTHVEAALARERAALQAALQRRASADAPTLAAHLQPLLAAAARAVLVRLYPDAARAF